MVKKTTLDSKTTAIVSHFTFIGWIIALVNNSEKKDIFASFYIRQTLGLISISVATSILLIIPFIGSLLAIITGFVCVVAWVISLINAIGGKMEPLPILGDKFQEWFNSIG